MNTWTELQQEAKQFDTAQPDIGRALEFIKSVLAMITVENASDSFGRPGASSAATARAFAMMRQGIAEFLTLEVPLRQADLDQLEDVAKQFALFEATAFKIVAMHEKFEQLGAEVV
jgi:hypothetical protein